LPAPIENGGRDRFEKKDEFLTFNATWPWPWMGPRGIPSCITHRPLLTHQISL